MTAAPRRLSALPLLAALTGCAPLVDPTQIAATPVDRATLLAECCGSEGPLPPAAFAAFEALAPAIVPILRDIRLREAGLAGSALAEERLRAAARPLDLVLVSTTHRLSGRLAQGYFTHVALILGSEDQLRAEGVWEHPAIRPLQPEIRQGAIAIEANGDNVRLIELAELLDSDGLALLRPEGLSPAARQQALARLAAQHGLPFDFRFDAGTAGCLFCSELAAVALPGIGLPERVLRGRRTLVPDDIAAAALTGEADLALRLWLHDHAQGYMIGTPDQLARTLAAAAPP